MSKKQPNENKNIKAFMQHGFIKKGESGDNQVHGRCPFCGSEDKFYINIQNKAWDCKSGKCRKSGGYQTFLNEISLHTRQFFKQRPAITLHKDRGIKIGTFRKFNVGYNPFNNSYLIPIYDMAGEKIWNLRKYSIGNKPLSTAGCKVGLLGWEHLQNTDTENIWLCEGEWDGLALWEVLNECKINNDVVLSVPGANIFKSEWTIYFKDKIVNVLYDSGEAGEQGALKVYNNLSMITKNLRFIHWPDSYKDGFDIRDLYFQQKFNVRKTLSTIRSFLRNLPKGVDFGKDKKNTSPENKFTGKGLIASEVYSGYSNWLQPLDDDVLDVLYGTMIANKLPGDPIWLFLVGAPGCAKTELLMSISESIDVVTTTSLTPHALVSGANFAGGGDPSLVPKLDGKVLIIKDFTTILNMNPNIRDEIFGILRDAYDGKTEKIFGNGVVRSYESKFGLIAGVTPAIELYTAEHSALGERFLRFYIKTKQDEVEAMMRKAVSNITREVRMREDLKTIGKEVLKFNYQDIPKITEVLIDKVIALARWTAIMRSTITREKFSGEITHKPFTELGTRLAKQFIKLLMGIGMFRRIDKVTDKEYQIVKKIATGTIQSRVEIFIKIMYTHGKSNKFTIEVLSQMVGLPPLTCTRISENLAMLKVVKKIKTKGLRGNEWQLTSKIIELMERAELYTK